ncbi:MAG TPA: hypothetical protein VEI97_06325 [bacterium]|nr:hypothetical protein [bacterium]
MTIECQKCGATIRAEGGAGRVRRTLTALGWTTFIVQGQEYWRCERCGPHPEGEAK